MVAVLLLSALMFADHPPADADQIHFTGQETILKGLALSYQLKLEEALKVFKRLETEQPGSPASYFYPAAIRWGYTESYHRWKKVAELYAKTTPPEKPMPENSRLIEEMEQVIDRCQKRLQQNPDDFEAMFYMAGAHGFMARMEFYEGSYISAMLNGKSSAHYFDQLLLTWPDRGDAKLGPGVYKYYVGRLSAPLRFLVSLLGLEGTREEGLALIKQAHEKAILSSTESTDFLARIQRHEGNYSESLLWANELERMAPGSPIADYHRLTVYHDLHDRDHEITSAQNLLDLSRTVSPRFRKEWEPLLCFVLGVLYHQRGDEIASQGWFSKALEAGSADSWLASEIRLWKKNVRTETQI